MSSLLDHDTDAINIHAEAMMPLIREHLATGKTVHNLSFVGVSMLPMLRQGKDGVEIAALPEKLKKYDLPVYRLPNGKYVIHRIVAVKEDHYVCLGDNTYWFEKVAPEHMVALVCAFRRGERWISVENRAYRLYCRVWCAIIPVRRFLKRARWQLIGAARKLIKG